MTTQKTQEEKKPIKKWLCKKCNKEYTKPFIKSIKFGLVNGVSCCPYCKTPCIDLKTHLSNKTQIYIGDNLK